MIYILRMLSDIVKIAIGTALGGVLFIIMIIIFFTALGNINILELLHSDNFNYIGEVDS